MSFERAIQADREERFIEAADLYEACLDGEMEVCALVNLLVLYWESSSSGFYSAHHLPDSFIQRANRRFRELLATASERFPDEPSVRFWTKYIGSLEGGAELSETDAQGIMISCPEYLEPLIVTLKDGEHTSDAVELLRRCEKIGTARAKYIAAVLGGIFKRK
jgi:hypothetical protein